MAFHAIPSGSLAAPLRTRRAKRADAELPSRNARDRAIVVRIFRRRREATVVARATRARALAFVAAREERRAEHDDRRDREAARAERMRHPRGAALAELERIDGGVERERAER